MARTGLGWTAAKVVLFSWIATRVIALARAEDGRPNVPPPAVSQSTAKLIALKFRDPQYLHGVLMPLGLQISPDVQTNRLLVIGRPEEIKQVEDLVRELDVPIERTKDQPQLELKLYRLCHRQPDDLMQCVVPMLSERGRIAADAGSRTLLVKDEPTVHTDVAMIIREIDAPLGETVAEKTIPEESLQPAGQNMTEKWICGLRMSPPGTAIPIARERQTIKLRVRVCEINRGVVNGLGDEPTSIADNLLFREIRGGSPMQAAFESGAVEACVAEMVERGVLKVVCEPTIAVLSGSTATFVSCTDEFEGPVVIEEDSLTEATTRVSGLAVDLKFIPTVVEPGLIRLQMSAPFLPRATPASDSEMSEEDQPALNSAVELKVSQILAASGKIRIAKQAEPNRGGFGSVPVLGQLFRTKRSFTQESELIVLVAAEPLEVPQRDKLAREMSKDEPAGR